MVGDVDNIVKLILDAMNSGIFRSDSQVERVLVQKFDRDRIFQFDNPSSAPVLVLHGHKHMTMNGVFLHNGAEVFVHGSPSSTLGNCASPTSLVDGRQYWTTVRLSAAGWHVALHAVDSES